MTVTNQQVVFAPNLYANGGIIQSTSAKVVTLSAGSFRDSTNITDIIITDGLILNGAINGAGGLDTGSLAVNTYYYIHAIGSSMALHASTYMISTSKTAPVLPSGYDVFRFIGFLRTNNSNADFLTCDSVGTGQERMHRWDAPILVLNSGTANSVTAVDISAAAPPIDKLIATINVSFTPNSAGNYVAFGPAVSVQASQGWVGGVVTSQPQRADVEVTTSLVSGVSKINYINSAASCSTNALVSTLKYTI